MSNKKSIESGLRNEEARAAAEFERALKSEELNARYRKAQYESMYYFVEGRKLEVEFRVEWEKALEEEKQQRLEMLKKIEEANKQQEMVREATDHLIVDEK